MHDQRLSRRLFAASLGALPAAALLGCGGGSNDRSPDAGPRSLVRPSAPSPGGYPSGYASAPQAAESFVCAQTTSDIEGPYYKAGAPTRSELRDPSRLGGGAPLELEGRLLGPDCRPLSGAELEVWHADELGAYDLAGFGLRARVPIDASGNYHLRTVFPGRYLNGRVYRPSHIHLKLRAPGRATVTTQLYFEGDPYNDGDPWVHPSRVTPVQRLAGRLRVVRDFVLGA